ncbi:MAG: response regulator [Candidatus Aminicenantes bacterium]|nr:MAG: response regulator [Candidatus Aminicenantes bacterium]
MSKEKKILIVDDNLDYAEAIKTIVESGPYCAEVATSSKQAVDILDKEIPALIILDVLLQKGAEGIILSRRFKKDPKLKHVPIIMLTSMTQQTGFKFIKEDPRHPHFLPVEEFIEKPVAPNDLLAKIDKLVSAKETS